MRFAELNSERILANPLEKNAVCPLCKSSVIAKCGEIKIWHWAHKASEDCDSFGEPETEWHLNWKNEFPAENQETIIEKYYKKVFVENYFGDDKECLFEIPKQYLEKDKNKIKIKHRADVKIKDIVLEFQNSSISKEDVLEREQFYGRMKWILNGNSFGDNFLIFHDKGFYKFRWKWARKTWMFSNKEIYIDFGKEYDYLFLIKKLHDSGFGWGKKISKINFIENCKNGYY